MSEEKTCTNQTPIRTLKECQELEKNLRPIPMTKDEVIALATKIEALVRQECDVKDKSYWVGEALMLASHHLLGWRDFRKLIG
jgi:hypothetical protein